MRNVLALLAFLSFLCYSQPVTFTRTLSGSYSAACQVSPTSSFDVFCFRSYNVVYLQAPTNNELSSFQLPAGYSNFSVLDISASGVCDGRLTTNSSSCSCSFSNSGPPGAGGVLGSPYSCDYSGSAVCAFGTLSGSASCSFSFDYDCSVYPDDPLCSPPPDSTGCGLAALAASAEAFITGNNGRYELFDLNCSDREIIPVPLTSSIPFCNNLDCQNAAVSLDDDFNFVSDVWSPDLTSAIWIDPENLDCEANSDGYFVFCATGSSPPPDPPLVWVCEDPEGLGLCDDPPSFGSSSSGNWRPEPIRPNYSSSSSSDTEEGILPYLKNILPKILDKIPKAREIIDPILRKLDDIFGGEPPPLQFSDDWSEFDYDTLPPEFTFDTVPFDTTDKLKFSLDSSWVDDLIEKAKLLFDSIPFPFDTIAIPDSLPIPEKLSDSTFAEKILDQFKEMLEEVQEKVSENLEPLSNLVEAGGGGCSCLSDGFSGLSFGSIPEGSNFDVSAPSWVSSWICDHLDIIKRIVILINLATTLGMILSFLRRGD
jgi:hypothetical protein